MKTFRTTIAFFQALFTLIGIGVMATFFYSNVKSPYNIILAVMALTLGLILSRFTFNLMRRRGVLATMAGLASYDLDELEPTLGSNTLKVSSEELTKLFHDHKLKFNRGTTLAIWGDWGDRKLNTSHHLESINYGSKNKILNIIFSDNCIITITEPRIIFLSSSYLKIVKAKEIKWLIPNDVNSNNEYIYLNTGKEIKTNSNTQWKPHKSDLGIGMNALYLQG